MHVDRRHFIVAAGALALTAFLSFAAGKRSQPELVGTVAFDVQSRSGRVETLAVTIGDGGTGPYKAILAGDSSLPTHAIYRPRDLSPFNSKHPLPVVAFGNGGCRNTSGEFRNFLSDIASHGFLVVAIGPAGNAVVMGSEERTGATGSTQLLDGAAWAIAENERADSEYYHKVDGSKVAVMGQSCGGGQAIDVSTDPRVTTSIILNSGAGPGRPPVPAPANPAPPAPASPSPVNRYGPFVPPPSPSPGGMGAAGRPAGAASRMEIMKQLHGPIAFINGGPTDTAFASAKGSFEAVENVPALFAYQEVGHYPATYRQPNGGAFAQAVNAWLEWHLKGDRNASKAFVGADCRLCTDPAWKVERKNIQ